MFMAGYALNLSHLSWMVMLGMILLTLERRRAVPQGIRTETSAPAGDARPMLGQQA
jgi:hypothetical protein